MACAVSTSPRGGGWGRCGRSSPATIGSASPRCCFSWRPLPRQPRRRRPHPLRRPTRRRPQCHAVACGVCHSLRLEERPRESHAAEIGFIRLKRAPNRKMDFLRHHSDVQWLEMTVMFWCNSPAERNGGRLCWEATCQGISRSPMRQWRVWPLSGRLDKGRCFCTLDIGVMPQKIHCVAGGARLSRMNQISDACGTQLEASCATRDSATSRPRGPNATARRANCRRLDHASRLHARRTPPDVPRINAMCRCWAA